ncbi:MAG TPA: FHA domain-containing protein [Bdellovibrionales bacterium]|nr:FHA domain-containing protein [Bdellovibrionales bacterium]
MKSNLRPNLYLVHQETGQRYTLGAEVRIGRSDGDLIFRDDDMMSAAHCRLLRAGDAIVVQDLGSHNGTLVDGTRISARKSHPLKDGQLLSVGAQEFRMMVVQVGRPRGPARRRRSQNDPFLVAGIGALALAFGLTIYWQWPRAGSPPVTRAKILSPLEIVEVQMATAFYDYQQTADAYRQQGITDADLVYSIENILRPRLTGALDKMKVLKPQTEWERLKIAANLKYLEAMLAQTGALADYARGKDEAKAQELVRLSQAAERLAEDMRRLEQRRVPSGYKY